MDSQEKGLIEQKQRAGDRSFLIGHETELQKTMQKLYFLEEEVGLPIIKLHSIGQLNFCLLETGIEPSSQLPSWQITMRSNKNSSVILCGKMMKDDEEWHYITEDNQGSKEDRAFISTRNNLMSAFIVSVLSIVNIEKISREIFEEKVKARNQYEDYIAANKTSGAAKAAIMLFGDYKQKGFHPPNIVDLERAKKRAKKSSEEDKYIESKSLPSWVVRALKARRFGAVTLSNPKYVTADSGSLEQIGGHILELNYGQK